MFFYNTVDCSYWYSNIMCNSTSGSSYHFNSLKYCRIFFYFYFLKTNTVKTNHLKAVFVAFKIHLQLIVIHFYDVEERRNRAIIEAHTDTDLYRVFVFFSWKTKLKFLGDNRLPKIDILYIVEFRQFNVNEKNWNKIKY